MAVIANRRSVMTLFSRPTEIHSHRTRLVLAEKNINIEISTVLGNRPAGRPDGSESVPHGTDAR